ncbi:hypothetical protein HAV15_002489 [Penicillium sp. str. |nr:hypothetical protein HAV15_002489 [Penicillium sp. str. \
MHSQDDNARWQDIFRRGHLRRGPEEKDKTTEERHRLGIASAGQASHPSRRVNSEGLFQPVKAVPCRVTRAGQV